jgi:hypothetical protein
MKKLALFVSLAVVAVLCGCNAAKKIGTTPPAFDLTGSWEVIATSTMNSGSVGYVEFNAAQNGNNLTAAVQEFFTNTGAVTFANCLGATPGNPQGNITATVDSSSINGSFTETGPGGSSASFSIQAPLASASSFSGNYTGTANASGCVDAGTFVATKAKPLSGTYSGQLTFPNGSLETMSLTATEDSSFNITVTGAATGGSADGPIALTGTVTGNLARLQSSSTASLVFSGFALWNPANQKLYIVDDNDYLYGTLSRQ